MDLAQISTRTEELAARFGVRSPRVESGTACLRARVRKGKPILAIGAAFDDVPAAEQDGALARAVVLLDLIRTGQTKFSFAIGLLLQVPIVVLAVVAINRGVPLWQPIWPLAVALMLAVFGLFAAFAVWYRSIVYRLDRRVLQVMGRPLVDLMLEVDARERAQRRGLGMLGNLCVPGETRRRKRLDTIVPNRGARRSILASRKPNYWLSEHQRNRLRSTTFGRDLDAH
ncbi:hypothetical protein OG203_45555 [Nocardia sp. NBC_01499]|uniref:hypothetical protein n=1 Tax=Nocardia sp. NBC_01499 TaxID=2903597 RepID=UPI00386D86AC